SGKTSLLNLILAFYAPTEGAISLRGTDISKISTGSLRSQLAFLPQECPLLSGTILENIAYGAKRADRARVVEMAKLVRMHEFICQLPEKYDTHLSERG